MCNRYTIKNIYIQKHQVEAVMHTALDYYVIIKDIFLQIESFEMCRKFRKIQKRARF